MSYTNQDEDPSPEDDERDERSLAFEVIATAFRELRWWVEQRPGQTARQWRFGSRKKVRMTAAVQQREIDAILAFFGTEDHWAIELSGLDSAALVDAAHRVLAAPPRPCRRQPRWKELPMGRRRKVEA